MNRWLMLSTMTGLLLISSTGCMQHHLRGGCGSCSSGSCGSGDCGSGGTGLLGSLGLSRGSCQSCGDSCGGHCGGRIAKNVASRVASRVRGNGYCGPDGCSLGGCGRTGCMAGKLGWQQGGLDYSAHLNPGLFGHQAAQQMQNQPFTPGPPTGQVAYPYYSHHGPRDFLLDNPPTIGR